jgi:hypothetical protein
MLPTYGYLVGGLARDVGQRDDRLDVLLLVVLVLLIVNVRSLIICMFSAFLGRFQPFGQE